MRRGTAVLLAIVVAFGLLWRPLLYPGGKAALLLLDVYSPSLAGSDLAERVTPPVRVSETRETFDGTAMRVSWWRPGWGDSHPAIMIVNGATPVGNDNEATREFGATLARAGYLVMLPQFPFLVEGRLDAGAPAVIDAAFAHLRSLPETRGHPVGIFGASVGAGLALVAASRGAAAHADEIVVLGSYFDVETYVAAVASHEQRIGGSLEPWQPSDEVKTRLPPAVAAAMPDEADRAVVSAAFASDSYDGALARLEALSPKGRAVLDALSPSTVWPRVGPPVFWIHDPNDTYEPPAEAYAAEAAPRDGRFELVVPRLVQHAEVGTATQGRSALGLAGELWRLLRFTLDVLRIAG
ncbi:MAG: hypothetical protein KGJ98_05170 [Chloroflexota bacterium]|nr:hypothetical protein [Chloroflexota bacterium]